MKLHTTGSKISLIPMAVFAAVVSTPECSEEKAVAASDVKHKPIFRQYQCFRGIFERSGVKVVNGRIEDLKGARACMPLGPAHRVDEGEMVGFDVEGEPIEGDVVTGVPVKSNILTENVEKIVLYGAFRVGNPVITEKIRELRFSDRNDMGLAGFRRYGRGYVVVAGDDAGFTDQYADSGDSRVFVKSLAGFIIQSNG